MDGKVRNKRNWISILLSIGMLLCLTACDSADLVDASSSLEESVARSYVGRDCIFYHGQLYWNNGLWFSNEEDAQNLLPTDSYEEGQISRCVRTIPKAEGDAALLPEGTVFLYHEALDAIFVKKDPGYIQYVRMQGMKEIVEELCAMEPTGFVPGYDYAGRPMIFYEGQLYRSSATLYNEYQTGVLTQVGRIQCRCDAVPSEHLHSSNIEAGTIVLRSTNDPDGLVIYRPGSDSYQLFIVHEPEK